MRDNATDFLIPGQEYSWAKDQFRERVAVEVDGRSFSFAWVDETANRLANALRGLGLENNDRVAVLVDNSIDSVVTVIATTKAALTFVALNARQTFNEHLAVLLDCAPKVLIADAAYRDTIDNIVKAGWNGLTVGIGWRPERGAAYDELLRASSTKPPAFKVDANEYLPRIAYTSGTTGQPKGVAYSYAAGRARLANFYASAEYRLGIGDAMLYTAPMTHAAGNYLMPYFLRGGRAVILPRFDPERMCSMIASTRANHVFVVPTMLRRLLEMSSDHLDKIATLDRIFYGAAPAARDILEAALDRLGPILRQHYGMTEAPQPLSVLYPHEHEERDANGQRSLIETCGRPVLGVSMRICNPDGSAVTDGEAGEVAVKAQGACDVRYWRRPDLEAESIRDGWYHTGDLGRFDPNGYLKIEGRLKDMVISGGFNVYCGEVERALSGHPDIVEAAVFGTPDPEWGEVVTAWVVTRDAGSSGQSLVAEACSMLASYKRPKVVRRVATLPRNANGKIDKQTMRTSHASAAAAP